MGRKGFTLVEVLVALLVGGLVVLLAHRIFAAAGDAGRAIRDARTALDREMNARRWLQATFLSLEVGDSAGSFEGHPDRVAFSAWELTACGWFERRRIALGLSGAQMVATGADGRLLLADSIAVLDVDYLLEPGAEARWVREWLSPVSAPIAVRLRMRRPSTAVDTLLFLIKERG